MTEIERRAPRHRRARAITCDSGTDGRVYVLRPYTHTQELSGPAPQPRDGIQYLQGPRHRQCTHTAPRNRRIQHPIVDRHLQSLDYLHGQEPALSYRIKMTVLD